MLPIRHIAMACVTGAALSFGFIGCQSEQRPPFIPSNAELMDSGNGQIHYTAPGDGMVYIYDHAQTKLVWSGNILKGQSLDIDPMKNQVVEDNAIVTMRTLNSGDVNDVYFVPTPMPTANANAMNNAPQNNYNANNNYGGLTVTPSVSVQPNSGQPGSLTVQPGLNVAPTTQPVPAQ